MSSWSGRKVQAARHLMATLTTWPTRCARRDRCRGRTLQLTDDWVVGHIKSRATHPHLEMVVSNWQIECRKCSDASGQAAVIEKAKAEGARLALAGFSQDDTPRKSPPLPVSPHGAKSDDWEVHPRLRWAHHVRTAPDWLAPHLVVPEDASPPLAMTEVHPLAVCSYGASTCTHGWRGVPFVVPPSAIGWIERERDITLRWWQRLAIVRQLEQDVAGRLLWRVVVESGSRRIGKSERLRSLALWRMERGVELFEAGQIVVHVGRDLGVAREVQERTWSWCEARGWDVKTGNGKEAVTHTNGARWLVKSQNAGYGFDVHLGLADECWDIAPQKISGAIEPATMERQSSQLVLTSTSNQDATSLMKNRILGALTADDGRTLLLLWGIEPGADIFDERTWRAASAHWSEDRREQIAAKLREAQDSGPQLDDPDPIGSWANNYLNRWDLVVRAKQRGEGVVDADAWGALVWDVPDVKPAAAAIESWFGEGLSVALAWPLEDGPALVKVTAYDELAAAVAAVKASGFRGVTTVGASMVGDPALSKFRHRPGQGRTADAVKDLERMLREDVVRHDAGEHLTTQVLALRTVPSPDGARVSSAVPADAVKAAVWAIRAARKSRGQQRLVLSSS